MTSFPNGKKLKEANLKHWTPIGIPTMVIHHRHPASSHPSPLIQPPKRNHNKLPRQPIEPLLSVCFFLFLLHFMYGKNNSVTPFPSEITFSGKRKRLSSWHVCHNKSLAHLIWYGYLSISCDDFKPTSRCSATPFYLLVKNITCFPNIVNEAPKFFS